MIQTSATTKQAQEQRELARMFPATRRDAIDKLSSLGLGKLRELQEQTLLDAMAHDAMRGAYTTNRATQLYQLHDIIGTIIDYRETH